MCLSQAQSRVIPNGGSSLAEWSFIPRIDPGSGTCKVGAVCHPSLSCRVGGAENDVALGRRQLNGPCLIDDGIGPRSI